MIVFVVVTTDIIQSKSNLLKQVLKDRKKVKNMAKNVKEIKKGVQAIMDEILYVEGKTKNSIIMRKHTLTLC